MPFRSPLTPGYAEPGVSFRGFAIHLDMCRAVTKHSKIGFSLPVTFGRYDGEFVGFVDIVRFPWVGYTPIVTNWTSA